MHSSKFIRHFRPVTTSQRRHKFVKIIGNFWPICDVADSSKFISHFLPICDVTTASQIRQNLLIIFDHSMTSQGRRRFFKIYWSFSTNLRCRSNAADVKLYLSFSTNLRRRSDVVDSSKFIGHVRPICDVTATSQIRRNSFVIFDQSMTSLRRPKFVKIYW